MTKIDTAKEREKLATLEGHTPGPWSVDETGLITGLGDWVDERDVRHTDRKYPSVVADVDTGASWSSGANLRLIAAAPELKATLAAALDDLDAKDAEIERLRDALEAIELGDDSPDGMQGDIARAALNPEAHK